MHDESLIMTKANYVGRCVEPEDLVCILLECAMPMIPWQVTAHHTPTAEAHPEGVIHGLAMTGSKEGGKTLQDFELH